MMLVVAPHIPEEFTKHNRFKLRIGSTATVGIFDLGGQPDYLQRGKRIPWEFCTKGN